MKNRKQNYLHEIFITIISSCLLFTSCNLFYSDAISPTHSTSQADEATKVPGLSESPIEITSEMQPTKTPLLKTTERKSEAIIEIPYLRGINIGNALEAPEPGLWGVTIQKELIDAIDSAGFNAIRIPVRFSAHTGAAPEFTIKEEFLKMVDEVLHWSLSTGSIVILDFHGFEEIMENPAGERDHFIAIWQQIAGHYKDAPAELYFELLNEPSKSLDAVIWNELIVETVSVIRKTNPYRKIIIGGVNYSKTDTLFLLKMPPDENLIASLHFYSPFNFTHQGASWVNDSEMWRGMTWEGTSHEKQFIQEQLDLAVDYSNLNKLPIILGEFGVIQTADPASRERWIRFVVQEAEKRNIGWLYWDLCSDFRIFNCQDLNWDNTMLSALMEP